MSALRLIAVVALIVAASTGNAATQSVTTLDLVELKRLARILLGAPVRDIQPVLVQLVPYARRPSDLDHIVILLGNQHGYASVPLRGGFTFNYVYMNVPSQKDIAGEEVDLRPDIERRGNKRIEQVTIARRGKIVFAIGEIGKPAKPRNI